MPPGGKIGCIVVQRTDTQNFWEIYRPLADEWHLYFNGGDSFEMVASGDPTSLLVFSQTRLDLFMEPREQAS